MRITRRPLAELDPAEYDPLVAESFYASRGFLTLWRVMGGRPMVWSAEDAGRLVAVLPGIEYGRGPIQRFVSQPDGCYGGMFMDPAANLPRLEVATALLDAIVRQRYAKAVIFDYAERLGRHPEFEAATCETRIINIAGHDWVPEDSKLQYEIRRAGRAGLAVERFDHARHRAGLEQLIELTAQRHGTRPRYRMQMFQRLAALADTDPRIRWRHCEREGKPVASQIYFVERGMLVSWQDYSCRDYSSLKPNQFIRWELCRQAASEGIEWLNLGSSPDDADGLGAYKLRWGGTTTRYSSLTRWGGLGALMRPRVKRETVGV